MAGTRFPREGLADKERKLTMTAKLPSVLADYFTATNAHDVTAMLASFAEAATVQDEGGQHQGLAAIRSWMIETIEKYDFQVDPLDSAQAGSEVTVRAAIRGKFPGSPVTLRY